MIKLNKKGEPQILADNSAAWTAAIEAKYASGEKPSPTEMGRYRHPDIKKILIEETNGKCAYCESKLLHIHHGDVEHIYPKSLDRKQTFKWDNLTLACERCNQNKSDNDPLLKQIIDPYLVDPSHHLTLLGPLPRGKTPQGVSTIELLKLHRSELVEQREEALKKLYAIIYQIKDDRIAVKARRAMYKDLKDESESGCNAYSAMVRVALQVEAVSFDAAVTS